MSQLGNQPGSQAFAREPVMWTATVPDYNKADRERVRIDRRTGRTVVERIPQIAQSGDYDNRQPIIGADGRPLRRWLPIVNQGGHVVPVVFTNAAAHIDTNCSFAQYQWGMIRSSGWFYKGACPVALIASGELRKEHVLTLTTRDEKVWCEPGTFDEDHPCPHCSDEIAARQARNAAAEEEREHKYKSDTERQIIAQKETNQELIKALGTNQRELIESLLARPQPAPNPAPAGEDPQVTAMRAQNESLAQAVRDLEARIAAAVVQPAVDQPVEQTEVNEPPAPAPTKGGRGR